MSRLQRGKTVEELEAALQQAKAELVGFQGSHRLHREAVEEHVERWLRTARDLERDHVAALAQSIGRGRQHYQVDSLELLFRQQRLESPAFADWFRSRVVQCFDRLLLRREHEAELARLEAAVAAAEVELEEARLAGEEGELKRRRASLRERAKTLVGGGRA